MADENSRNKSRKGMFGVAIAIILALLFFVISKAKATAKAVQQGGGLAPVPSAQPPTILTVPEESPEQIAAAGNFEIMDVQRAFVGGASVRAFVMIDPDLCPKDGEAWVVVGFTAYDSDTNGQGLDGALVSEEQARIIDRNNAIAGISGTTFTNAALTPTWIKLFTTSGNANESSFDQFRDQNARGATGLRLQQFIIPPHFVFLLAETNNLASSSDHFLGLRILFYRVRAGQTQLTPQKTVAATGGLGKWISSLTK